MIWRPREWRYVKTTGVAVVFISQPTDILYLSIKRKLYDQIIDEVTELGSPARNVNKKSILTMLIFMWRPREDSNLLPTV